MVPRKHLKAGLIRPTTLRVKTRSAPVSGSDYVVRGSYWILDADICRSAFRINLVPAYRNLNFGFRLSRTV